MAKNNTSTQKLVNELEKAVDESKKLVKLTSATNELYIEMAKSIKGSFDLIDKKTTKGLSDFNKALANTNTILEKQEANNKKRIEANDDLAKQEKKLVTLRNKLNDGLSEGAVETEKLNTQIREQNKKRKEAVNDSLGLVSAYSKESKALRKMKNDLKSNIIEMRKLGKSEKEIATATKKTAKEINKLDRELRDLDKSVGDSFREIGKYEEALNSLGSTSFGVGKALAALSLDSAISGATEILTETITKSREAQQISGELANAAKAPLVVAGADGVLLFKSLKEEAKATKKAIDEYKDAVAEGQDEPRAKKRLEDILAIQEAEKKIREENNASPAFQQRIKDTEFLLDLADKEANQVSISNNELERSLSIQIKRQQELKALSDDDNRGFKELIDFKDELAKQDDLVAEGQEKLARNELDLQTTILAGNLVARGKLSNEKALNLTAEEANELLKDKSVLMALSNEQEEAFTQAFVGFQEARTESSTTALETQEKRAKLLSDVYERDLDILIDGGDKLKVINEKIIADDTISNDRRQALLTETRRLTEKGFKEQAKVIETFARKRIDLDITLTDSEKKTLKEKISASDIEALLSIKDAKVLNEKIRLLGLSEIFEGRTLEVIREKIQANEDLTLSQKDVNAALAKTNEINEDIADQEELLKILRNKEIDTEEELDKEKEKLEDERLQNRLDAIDVELKGVEKGSLEEAALNQEKNDILIEQETKASNKRIALKLKEKKKILDDEKAELAARKKIIEEGVKVIEDILANSREKQNSALDAEIDALDSRIQTIRDAINSGNSEAQQSLAQLEKQKIEAEKKKEELRKKEIRDAKIIAGLQLLAANSNDPNAVGKTLGDVSLLLAALSSLPSFFDGTEDTGTVAKPLDSNGGRHAVLHDNERVMTAKQNAKLGGISNEDLADLGAMHNNGALSGGTTIIQANNKELLQEVREMSKAIKSIPTQTYNYDANGKYHEQVITSRNKKITSKSRANNLFK